MNLTSFLGHFLLFGAPMGFFWGRGRVHKLIWGLLMLLSNFHFLRFLQFGLLEFDLILGLFLSFWSPNGLLLGLGYGSKSFLGSNHVVEQLLFSILPILYSQNLFLKILQIFWRHTDRPTKPPIKPTSCGLTNNVIITYPLFSYRYLEHAFMALS